VSIGGDLFEVRAWVTGNVALTRSAEGGRKRKRGMWREGVGERREPGQGNKEYLGNIDELVGREEGEL